MYGLIMPCLMHNSIEWLMHSLSQNLVQYVLAFLILVYLSHTMPCDSVIALLYGYCIALHSVLADMVVNVLISLGILAHSSTVCM